MNPPIIRNIELESALLTRIREKGSPNLLNALEDCEIRVETVRDHIYSVASIASHYDIQATEDLCDEIQRIGLPLGIFPCNCGNPRNITVTITVTTVTKFGLPQSIIEKIRINSQTIQIDLEDEGSQNKGLEDKGGEV
jgi:hypothetical protein